ncbi:MAG: hypothetical protein ABI823_04760, partial [Bryobacteraceae bacterium]
HRVDDEALAGQGLQCTALSSAPILHVEGVTEKVGEISMNCQGGQANQNLTGNLNIFLNVNLTNRLTSSGFTDIVLTVDNGSGPVLSNVQAQLVAANQAVFNGLSFTLSSQGAVVVRIINVRANATQARGSTVQMQIAFNAANIVSVFTSQFTVGIPLPSMLGSTAGRLLCSAVGSPFPDYINSVVGFATAGSAVSSFRVTEGFAASFSPRSDASNFQADSGVRIIFKYTGYPAAARIFVPDVIVGTDGTVPTSAGDLGLPVHGGAFTAGSSALLLARVSGASATGAGGVPNTTAPPNGSGIVTFDTTSEVLLDNGTGYAVYEVISGDQFSLQSAQIPTFLTLPPGAVSSTFQTQQDVFLAAVSSTPVASPTAAVPRFVSIAPTTDCITLNDCNAPYFPKLVVDTPPALQFSANTTGAVQTLYVPVRNEGGGVLFWSAGVIYNEVTGWLRLDPASAFNNGTIRVDAVPNGLPPGIYSATIRVNAGLSGVMTVPVKLTVGTGPSALPPVVTSVRNAASEFVSAIVPGSRAVINGDRFTGANILISIDGAPAAIIERSVNRLLILVPDSIGPKNGSLLTISIDGNSAPSVLVNVAAVAPVIYPAGVLNLDFSENTAQNPAYAGTAFQVFATGLPLNGKITGRVHDIDIFDPLYAGPAPGAIGIQQVNLQIHPLFPTFQTFIYVCGQVPGGERICSSAIPIWLRSATQ